MSGSHTPRSQDAESQPNLFTSFASSSFASPFSSTQSGSASDSTNNGPNLTPGTNASSSQSSLFMTSSSSSSSAFGRLSSPSAPTDNGWNTMPSTPSRPPFIFGSASPSSTLFSQTPSRSAKPAAPLDGSQTSSILGSGNGTRSLFGQQAVPQPQTSAYPTETRSLFGRPVSQTFNPPNMFGAGILFGLPTQADSSNSRATESLFGARLHRPVSAEPETSRQRQSRNINLSPADIPIPSRTANSTSSRFNHARSVSSTTPRRHNTRSISPDPRADRPSTRGSVPFIFRSGPTQPTRTSAIPRTPIIQPPQTPQESPAGSTRQPTFTTPIAPSESQNIQSITVGDLFDTTPNRVFRSPQRESLFRTASSVSDSQASLVEGLAELGTGGYEASATPSVANDFNVLDLDDDNTTEQTPPQFEYSARDEPLPAGLPYYDAQFQRYLRDGKNVATTIAELLRNFAIANEAGSSLNRIFETATELSQYNSPTTRIVGVVGNTGQGKSSLVNALLDEKELAKTNSMGGSVTSFVTEYRYALPHHTSAYVVEVEYLKDDELRTELSQLLDDYRYLHTPRNELEGDALHRAQVQSTTAEATLAAAFGNQPNWDTGSLRDFSAGGRDIALANLENWATTLQWPNGARDGNWSDTANSSQHCLRLIEGFMSDTLWPFVKVVRVYLRAAVLKLGLILADLPGFRDLNYARVQAARRYLARCNEIFIVSDIKRVVADETIRETIREIIREHVTSAPGIGDVSTPNICIICSHSTQAWSGQLSPRELEVLNSAKSQMREARQGEWMNERQYKEGKIRYAKLFATARNRDISRKLGSIYAHARPTVFCVDTKLYRTAWNLEAVEVSGIPSLRQFCYRIPAQALYNSAHNFLHNSLPSLVRSLDLWYESGRENGSQPLLNTVSTAELREQIDAIEDTFSALFSLGTVSLSYSQNRNRIIAAASAACQDWDRMAFRSLESYAAWCRHNGTYGTKAIEFKCWNSELISPLAVALRDSWDSLDQEYEDSFSTFRGIISGLMHQIRQTARGARAPQSFLSNILSRERAALHILDEQYHSYRDSFRSLKRDATGGHNTSFIVDEMVPTYKACARDSGTGVHARIRRLIHQHVDDKDALNMVYRAIKVEHARLVRDMTLIVQIQLGRICDDIQNDLIAIHAADTSLLERYPIFFHDLSQVLVSARATVGSWG
ncbi:hypothetical protein AJ78_06233 [Emergomyces pasteurianus Ep9510]|uniref:G domain-containing protein n=1 Tax=Emergomyces pasteurianus Ep9510 TaxID=1447872 RepID=A0A1J9PZH6_9EURO|nr:hypothetical protein AJ78_06233 [Emergomyces pasteurianus Ep9510]